MLEQLVELSNRYGKDQSMVLAGGGNTSFKDEKTLYIKGSGTGLHTIRAEGFVAMDRQKVSAMLETEYPDDDSIREARALRDMMSARLPGNENKRPSVETPLHNLFPYRYVLHVHPTLVNGLTCGKKGEAMAGELFGGDMVWVPLNRPGYSLAVLCQNRLSVYKQKTGRDAQVVFLQNHGIFVAADTVGEIDSIMENVMDALKKRVIREPETIGLAHDSAAVDGIAEKIAGALGVPHVLFCLNEDIAGMLQSKRDFEPLASPFTPDHIVYCKAKFLYLEWLNNMDREVRLFRDKYGYPPKVVCVQGVGAFLAAETLKEAENARMLFEDAVRVAVYSESFGGPQHMTDEIVDFILNWEVESYRQKVSMK